MKIPSREERVLGSLWGSAAGDALGVPVEFRNRSDVQANPVTGMRAFGTHRQPAGTWSDDSSLLLCSAESLLECDGFDSRDMGQRFVRWRDEAYWTPHGRVFDIGGATSQALSRISRGTAAETAGGTEESSNGNGSLMRILPVALWFSTRPLSVLLDAVHRASAITHRHPRSQMACGLFALLVRELIEGASPEDAYRAAISNFGTSYTTAPFAAERPHFRQLESGSLATMPEDEIGSSGYVIDTLTASLWCLLTSGSFEEAVLKGVNLGSDTDTTGCVAGGLAGLYFGQQSIPSPWIEALARRADLDRLFQAFAKALPQDQPA